MGNRIAGTVAKPSRAIVRTVCAMLASSGPSEGGALASSEMDAEVIAASRALVSSSAASAGNAGDELARIATES